MFKLSDTAKALIKSSIIISLLFLGVFALIDFENIVAFSYGIFFGLIFTILKISLLEKNIKRALELNSVKSNNYMKLHFLFRYLLTAVVLAIAGMYSSVTLIGCILALISLQLSAYVTNLALFKKIK